MRSLSEDAAASSRAAPRPAPGPTVGLPSALAAGRTRTFAAPRRLNSVGRPGGCRGSARFGEPTSRAPPRTLGRRPTGRDVLLGEKCTRSEPRAVSNERGRRERRPSRGIATRRCDGDALNLPVRSFGFLRFTPERFHVLLNSLFKVLFNFPSRYLFAIGLVVIFSLRWSLPPA